ncbi:uncharacterized protein LOC132280759 [Cornus florida]|uniref:uncharacterized protein LOC132280759 n=1 Tax=Cornus florida TaxID=4283 RepID=UPI0028A25591|nr:uncharacterized protein LOC132280759 [Cornus florida]
MEIEGQDGSKTLLKKGFKRELGRGLGFDSNDRTISRRHVVFEFKKDESQTDPNSESRVCFEVTGNNPIWVRNRASGEIRVFRRSERGEMEGGDMFCVSAKKPVWFTLKRTELEGENESEMNSELGNVNELADCLQSSYGLRGVEDLELDSADDSNIDPIKEFGFLIIGHEFDHFPKQMICDAKSWDWFLEESTGDSDNDDLLENRRKKGTRRKRKKGRGGDDDDWTGESEDDKESITKIRKVSRPKYSTRSKEHGKPIKDGRISKHAVAKKPDTGNEDDEEDEDDDDDEDTLGGFIVKDDDIEQEEEESDVDEEEEEDFEDDDE